MQTTTYIIGNWKANKTTAEAKAWFKATSKLPRLSTNLKIVLCVPFIHLRLLQNQTAIKSGVQDISPYPDGAYTGAISARMLAGEIDFAILGHSERRDYFHETNQQIAAKATQALEYKITPVIGVSQKNWRQQLNQLSSDQRKKSIVMFEPPEAISRQIGPIGVGSAAPIDEVVAVVEKIKSEFPEAPVLYGGSVKASNISTYLKQSIIDGVVPGSASLNASEWLKLLTLSQKIRGK